MKIDNDAFLDANVTSISVIYVDEIPPDTNGQISEQLDKNENLKAIGFDSNVVIVKTYDKYGNLKKESTPSTRATLAFAARA